MRTIVLGVCGTCLFLSNLPYTVAAPTGTDEPALPNVEALGAREPDRWQGRHHDAAR